MNRKLKLIDKELGSRYGIGVQDIGKQHIEFMIEEGLEIEEILKEIEKHYDLIRIDTVAFEIEARKKREKREDE